MPKAPFFAALSGCIFTQWAIGQLRKNFIIEGLQGESNRVGLDWKLEKHLGTFLSKPMTKSRIKSHVCTLIYMKLEK